jgi:adenylate kinase
MIHLSTGEVLRDEIARGTELGRRVQAAVERGGFADDETVLGIVMERLKSPGTGSGFILDGFPRTLRQAEALEEHLEASGRQVDRAILIDAPEELIVERLAGRRVCESCGETYHAQFHPPEQAGKCDKCGGAVVLRADDRPEKQRERLRAYREKTAPLIDFYRSAGNLVVVSGEGTIEEVGAELEKAVSGGSV